MTADEIAARVNNIRAITDDVEAAHSAEDRLWEDTLETIANGAPNPIELARAALRTNEIDFPRYCA